MPKLRKFSFDELRVRGVQKLSALAERRGWSSFNSLPSDDLFRTLLKADPETFLKHFRSRQQPHFFHSFEDRQRVVDAWRKHWPNAESELLKRCNNILHGKLDLLGLKQLDFGNPIDWHLEPVSGKRSSLVHWSHVEELDAVESGDKKIVWELNRHQHFIQLGQAYWLTNDERYAEAFAAQLSTWIDQNPPKLGINWTSSLEIAFRSISWIWSFYFFKHSSALTADLFWRALKILYLNAHHLETYLSTYFSPNTHLTGEALGLYYLGTIFPEFGEAHNWRATGKKILLEQLPLHVKDDGVYFEQSSYYHRYTADFYIHFLLLATSNNDPFPDLVGKKIQQLLDHLMYITRPDGTMPLFGDDDGGRLMIFDPAEQKNDARSSLATGAVIFKRQDYKFVAEDRTWEVLWLLGPAGLDEFDAMTPAEPRQQSIGFPEGGYYVMRDGWSADANYLLFDCGPHGFLNCGHAHADALAFDLAVKGRTLLVDPGTFSYTGSGEARDWFRSSPAHNTLTIDRESSSVPAGPFSWSSVADIECKLWVSRGRFDFIRGSHNGYRRLGAPATHTRSVFFLKNDYWIILDEVETSGNHDIDLWFHFDSGASPAGLDLRVFARKGDWRREDGWVSHCYGSRESAPLCVYSAKTEGSEQLTTFLLPRTDGMKYSVREVKADGGKAFEVTHANGVDIVMMLGSGSRQVETARLVSDFAWTWVRFTDQGSEPAEWVVLEGTTLSIDGKQVDTN